MTSGRDAKENWKVEEEEASSLFEWVMTVGRRTSVHNTGVHLLYQSRSRRYRHRRLDGCVMRTRIRNDCTDTNHNQTAGYS